MLEEPAPVAKGGRNTRITWLIAVGLALVFLWIIYSATQASTTNSSVPTMPGTSGVVATAMPQSMPGMNH